VRAQGSCHVRWAKGLWTSLPHVARDFLNQGSSGYIGAFMMFARGLVLAALLSPTQLGVLAAVSLLTSYAQFADLGATAAMEQRIPELAHNSDDTRVDGIRRAGYSAKLLGTGAASLAVLLYLVFIPPSNADMSLALAFSVFLFPVQGLFFVQQSYLRATRQFGLQARMSVLGTTLNLVGAVAGGLAAGLAGILACQLLASLVTVLYGVRSGAILGLRGRPSWVDVRELLLFGWPLVLLLFAQYSLVYVDQIVTLWALGKASLGAYSLVTAFGTMVYFVPMAVSAVMAPRLLSNFAVKRDMRVLAVFCWRPTDALRIVMPGLIAVSWAGVWLIFHFVLRKYEVVAGPATLIYLISIYFLGVNLGPNATLIALRKHPWNLPVILSVVAINVTADWALLRSADAGLEAIAWGSVIAYASYLVLHLSVVLRQFTRSWWIVTRLLGRYLWPGLVLVSSTALMLSILKAESFWSVVWLMIVGNMLTLVLGVRNRRAYKHPFAKEANSVGSSQG
jgi:O-antigen/teichoic acid export membrane protein